MNDETNHQANGSTDDVQQDSATSGEPAGGKSAGNKSRGMICCGTCGASVGELRRGRCWACYARWQEQRPVGLGACCAVCDERRRDNLRLLEVQGRSLPLCHLCAAHVQKLDVVPYSVEGLRAALRRDRRNVERREGGSAPKAFPTDRRAARRRSGADSVLGIGAFADEVTGSVWQIGDEDLALDLDLNADGELALDDADIVEDVTVIAQEPQAPAVQAVSDATASEATARDAIASEATAATASEATASDATASAATASDETVLEATASDATARESVPRDAVPSRKSWMLANFENMDMPSPLSPPWSDL